MLRTGQPVTFRGLAAAAPVSLDFLYPSPALRQRIEQLRAQPHQRRRPARRRRRRPEPAGARATSSPRSPAQLTQLKRRHREEIAELRRALQAAHGENLMLRRRLGQQPQAPSAPDQ